MKLQYLIQQVYHEPALITPAAHASIRQLLESRLLDNAELLQMEPDQAAQRVATVCGEKVKLPSMAVDDNGVAHIPIAGVIGYKLGDFARWAGAVDVRDVMADIAEVENDSGVRGALFDMDTPGGMVAGTPELAAAIADMTKPKYGFTDGKIASAGYWLAASMDGVFCTYSAEVGGIGVYTALLDSSARMKAAGLSVDVIKSGKYKGMGTPGTSLTDDQRDLIQQRIDMLGEMFRTHVAANRPGIKRADMQGQMFLAPQALERGLIDAVVKNKAEVVALI
jgi:signal peptide peptidase SppA